MAFNVNDFRNALAFGGARPSQFEMNVTIPAIVANATAAARQLIFLCHVAVLPQDEITDIPVRYFGRFLHYAGERPTFKALTISIYNDEDFAIKGAFEEWMAAITQHQQTISAFDGSNVSGGYCTDSVVRQYSRNNNGGGPSGAIGVPIKAYQFIGMYPTTISEIALSWAASDTIESFDVTFQYQYWLPLDVSATTPLAGF